MAIKASATITLSFMVDIKATYRYYMLQASTVSTPAVPTTASPDSGTPPSGWTDSEPSYTSGSTNTLYFVDLTVFTNDTWSYSKVSKSSSYEAAKEAWNKANSVQDNVDDAYNKLDTKITEQATDILATTESIIIKASETFVQTGDYEKYKTTLDAQFELLKNQIEARFTTTNSSIQSIDGKLTTEFEKLFTYIRLSDEGIEIGKSDNPILMKLDNDDLAFYQNGNKVAYISNNELQIVEVNIAKSLVIGNFGFIPRKNGSMDFKRIKIGG